MDGPSPIRSLFGLHSPIQRAPIEVLTEIFRSCVQALEISLVPYNMLGPCISKEHPSLVVSHVCKEWRAIALGDKWLWSHIRFRMEVMGEPDWLREERMNDAEVYSVWSGRMQALHQNVKMWIKRSSPLPIKLDLNYEVPPYGGYKIGADYLPDAQHEFEALVDTLCQSSYRWKELQCFFEPSPVNSSIVKIFDRPSREFPVLNKIHLELRRWEEVPILPPGGLFTAPSLRSVSLSGWWGAISTTHGQLEASLYPSFTHLELDDSDSHTNQYSDGAKALDLLGLMPNLESVLLDLRQPRFPLLPLAVPITLHHLTSLSLSNEKVIDKNFVASLELPTLTSLSLNASRSINSVSGTPTEGGQADLLLRFGHQLKELALYHGTLPEPVLSRCLKQLSNVVSLRLLARGFVEPVCDERDISILEELSNAGICPQLEDLDLKYFSNGEGDGRTEMALVDLCTSRVGQLDGEEAASSPQSTLGRRIRRVKASFSQLSKVDVLGELRRCGVDLGGVEMSISYPPPHLICEGRLVWP